MAAREKAKRKIKKNSGGVKIGGEVMCVASEKGSEEKASSSSKSGESYGKRRNGI